MKKKYDMVMRRKIMKYSVMALIIMFTVLIYKVPIVSARVMDAATEHGGGYEMPLGGWPYSNSTNSSITSTQKPSTPKPHVHDFDYDYEAPTCTSYGYSSSYCSCGAGSSHPIAPLGHAPSSTWSTDKTNHWKMCTRSGCGAIAVAKEVHYDNNVDGKCDACEYLMLLPSTLSVSPSYVAMEIGKTATVSYAYNGDGTVSISNNSNSGVATSQITDDFEGKITVTGVSSGTTTITLSAPQTSLYTAASVTFDAYVYVPNYEVNGRTYETLERAIAAVTTSNQTEIKVLQDVTDSSVAEIPNGKDIVLNTNGKTITKTDTPVFNSGTFKITGTGKIETLSQASNALSCIIFNEGNLTIEEVTLEDKGVNNQYWYTIFSVSGMITVNSGKIIASGNTGSGGAEGRGIELRNTARLIVNSGEIKATSPNSLGIEIYACNDEAAIHGKNRNYPTNTSEVNILGGIVEGSICGIQIFGQVGDAYQAKGKVIVSGGLIRRKSWYLYL